MAIKGHQMNDASGHAASRGVALVLLTVLLLFAIATPGCGGDGASGGGSGGSGGSTSLLNENAGTWAATRNPGVTEDWNTVVLESSGDEVTLTDEGSRVFRIDGTRMVHSIVVEDPSTGLYTGHAEVEFSPKDASTAPLGDWVVSDPASMPNNFGHSVGVSIGEQDGQLRIWIDDHTEYRFLGDYMEVRSSNDVKLYARQ